MAKSHNFVPLRKRATSNNEQQQQQQQQPGSKAISNGRAINRLHRSRFHEHRIHPPILPTNSSSSSSSS
ncbi:hypothetical protein M0802_010183 [Mischocyttarus mexicanus]|nr:hypothetical protein M0802_010183 [Mischocyttarus mexicanus]